MKAFLTRFGLFVLPVFVGIILLFWKPLNKQFAYSHLLQSCERSDFVYHQIFEGEPIDIAFIGTSVTICGVRDDSLEAGLQKRLGEPLRTVNLGFCRPGRSLQYVMLKDLLAHHHPKLILLEVRFQEDRFSHKDFPYVAESSDLWGQNFLFNQRYPEAVLTGLKTRWDASRHQLLQIPFEAVDSVQIRPHSYIPVDVQANPDELERLQQKTANRYKQTVAEGRSLSDQITYRYPRKMIGEIARLAKEKDIPIVFYFFKSYGHLASEPWELDLYRQYGEVWQAPDSIFLKKEHYTDQVHLNVYGADLVTDWLEDKIVDFLERM